MYNKIITNRAKIEYTSIGQYIAQDNLYYAKKVLEKIDEVIDMLIDFPYIGKEISDIYRIIIEPEYKFKIVYRIDKQNIYIISIFKEQNFNF